MPSDLLSSSQSLTILTFKAEGSMLLSYLNKLGHRPIIKRDDLLEENFRKQAAKLIKIKSIPSIEKLTFTYTGQTKGMKCKKYCKKVSTALKNLRGRELKHIDLQDILITCSKQLWYKDGKNNKDGTARTAGFSKNSKMFRANWIANTTRGTNDYSHCSTLIYIHDQHLNPFIGRWLEASSKQFNDAYALTELIQWVWRSRIRNGKPITVYLPSKRMRSLLIDWLEGEGTVKPLSSKLLPGSLGPKKPSLSEIRCG